MGKNIQKKVNRKYLKAEKENALVKNIFFMVNIIMRKLNRKYLKVEKAKVEKE